MNYNYKLVAIQVGDLLKYDISINAINRAARSLFNFQVEQFQRNSITSERAGLIYDWVLTLAKQDIDNHERNRLLIKFLKLITPESKFSEVEEILRLAGINADDSHAEFYSRNFHAEIHKNCLTLYKQGNYFHAVFEAVKVYNKLVKEKAKSCLDGYNLMMFAWDPAKGVLKVTRCETETDKNVQNGIKFLSAGLMQAVRNPTAHEPALHWPISKEDCLDLLSFISFLLRQLDKAVYFKCD